MSNARNLADVISGNYDVPVGALGNANDASALTTGTLPVDRIPYLTNRNRIINGDMRVSQRGSVTVNAGGSGKVYCAADRWNINDYFGAGQIVSSLSTDVPSNQGFTSSLKMECTTTLSMSVGTARVRQYIEGYNIADAYTGDITISFWIKSNVTGTYVVQVANSDFSRTYNSSVIINSANTWEKKTVTIPLADGVSSGTWYTDNNAGLQLSFVMNASTRTGSFDTWQTSGTLPSSFVSWGTSGDTLFITGVQLEEGSVATPFEHRQYGQELALCQRYFRTNNEVSGGANGDGGRVAFRIDFTGMRAQPVISLRTAANSMEGMYYGRWSINTILGYWESRANCIGIEFTPTTNFPGQIPVHLMTDALNLSSEL